jgi:hypothetical protein
MKSVQCFSVFFIKVVGGFFYSRLDAVTTVIEKNPGQRTTRYRVFLQRKYLDQVAYRVV